MRTEKRILSDSDRQIIKLLSEGYDYESISKILDISQFTVKKNIWIMMKEHNFKTPYQLITWAYQGAVVV